MAKYGPNILGGNEMATRYALIDPILKVMGWDLANPKYVRLAWGQADGLKPDYTCLKKGTIVLYVEAKCWGTISGIKKLENPLASQEIKQLAKYCKLNSVKIGVLTDGGAWYIIDFSNLKKPEYSLIDAANADKATIKNLLKISYKNF